MYGCMVKNDVTINMTYIIEVANKYYYFHHPIIPIIPPFFHFIVPKYNLFLSLEYYMATGIGPITDGLIDGIIKEINKKKTKNKIMKNIFEPLLCDLTSRYYPHFMTVTVILTIMILLLISILLIVILARNDSNQDNAY